jgi:hypothetical protein
MKFLYGILGLLVLSGSGVAACLAWRGWGAFAFIAVVTIGAVVTIAWGTSRGRTQKEMWSHE